MMKALFKENKFIILIALAAILVAFLPLYTVNCIGGHDIEYHLLRIEALKTGILAGHPFLRVNMLYFGGRGYASSLFYPDLLLYFPALLRAAGVPINLSFHLFVALCILLSFGAMFYSVYLLVKDSGAGKANGLERARYTALIAAIIYTLAQYHLDDIYTRSAVGEYTAMIFLPFLIYGLYDMLWGDLKRPWMMIIGFAGVLLCHTTTTVFAIGAYAFCFVLLVARMLIVDKKFQLSVVIRLIVAAFIVLAITAFYWLPMLEQFMSAAFWTDAGGFDLAYERLSALDIFTNKNPGLGVAIPVLCLFRFLIGAASDKSTDKSADKSIDKSAVKLILFADIMLLLGSLFAIATTGILPWARLARFLNFVQFPWRLLIMATAFLSVAAAIYVVEVFAAFAERLVEVFATFTGRLAGALGENWVEAFAVKLSVVVVLAIMLVSAISNMARLDQEYYSYSNDYYAYVPFTGNVIGGEWLPKTVTDRGALLKDCDVVLFDDGDSTLALRNANSLSFEVKGDGTAYADVPFIFYKGYSARDAAGNSLRVDGTGNNGSVRVYLDNAAAGVVTVSYTGTLCQQLATILSIITAIALIAYLFIKKNAAKAGEIQHQVR